MTCCSVVYVLSFFFLGVAADFRYAYWCVLGTLTAAVAAAVLCRNAVILRSQRSCAALEE